MELIDQHTKQIMEGCKIRARDAGLAFHDETLEYIVTNRDLLELGPKNMIPTLYDYWVQDIEVIKEKGRYELYPNNPYETVINTLPPISFYNDNNPDWLNVMIFYHVLAHIDFFQNNMMFKKTWDDDFKGQALSDKRLIARLRSEKGRSVDYVIEFSRGIDNLVGYYRELADANYPSQMETSGRLDYYFDYFLQSVVKAKIHEFQREIDRYNEAVRESGDMAESVFFLDILKKHPEFEALFEKHKKNKTRLPKDIIQYILENSPFLQKEENRWMKTVIQIIRNTSLFFQPQIRTKIMNEGWASYWHEKLFLKDDRIKGNEVPFARVNAKVTAMPRVGLNPYALGMRLFSHIEEHAEKGKLTYEYQKMRDQKQREQYDMKTGSGETTIFHTRENLNDFQFINTFVDQDFVNRHRLFVSGRRLNKQKQTVEYYVKSRNCEEYKKMLLESLYHPPHIEIVENGQDGEALYLSHLFEGKPLVKEYIANTMMGIEYLWGGPVKLETTEVVKKAVTPNQFAFYYAPSSFKNDKAKEEKPECRRVLYTMEKKKLSKTLL